MPLAMGNSSNFYEHSFIRVFIPYSLRVKLEILQLKYKLEIKVTFYYYISFDEKKIGYTYPIKLTSC